MQHRGEFARRGMSGLLELQLRDGVSRYCGIEDAELTVLHGTLTRGDLRPLLAEADDLVSNLVSSR